MYLVKKNEKKYIKINLFLEWICILLEWEIEKEYIIIFRMFLEW